MVQLDEGKPDEIVPMLADGALDLALVYPYETVPRRWPSSARQVTLMTEDLFILALTRTSDVAPLVEAGPRLADGVGPAAGRCQPVTCRSHDEEPPCPPTCITTGTR